MRELAGAQKRAERTKRKEAEEAAKRWKQQTQKQTREEKQEQEKEEKERPQAATASTTQFSAGRTWQTPGEPWTTRTTRFLGRGRCAHRGKAPVEVAQLPQSILNAFGAHLKKLETGRTDQISGQPLYRFVSYQSGKKDASGNFVFRGFVATVSNGMGGSSIRVGLSARSTAVGGDHGAGGDLRPPSGELGEQHVVAHVAGGRGGAERFCVARGSRSAGCDPRAYAFSSLWREAGRKPRCRAGCRGGGGRGAAVPRTG